jgi:hypothetical protein
MRMVTNDEDPSTDLASFGETIYPSNTIFMFSVKLGGQTKKLLKATESYSYTINLAGQNWYKLYFRPQYYTSQTQPPDGGGIEFRVLRGGACYDLLSVTQQPHRN